MRTIVVLIGATDDDTRDEAFRAAVGLTLRGARVHVAGAADTTHARRARATLELMGHTVGDRPPLADVVEVWGPVGLAPALPAPAARATTHLVRPGRRATCATPGEPVLHLPPVLDRDDADRLLDQLLAADRVVVW